jgi:transcriptional regulator with XRE-family HTH domain
MPGADHSGELAELLRALKARTNRSYDALARRVGVSSSALHRYCSGTAVPSRFAVLEEFAHECGATDEEERELYRRWSRAAPADGAASRSDDETPSDDEATPVPGHRTWVRLAPLAGVLLVAVGLASTLGPRLTGGSEPERPSEPAPATCTRREDVRYSDPRPGGREWRTAWSCPNTSGARIYEEARPSREVGIMDTAYSWFVCWTTGAPQPDGTTVWYYTQGDRPLRGAESGKGWGFMPASAVSVEPHPWPDMPRC